MMYQSKTFISDGFCFQLMKCQLSRRFYARYWYVSFSPSTRSRYSFSIRMSIHFCKEGYYFPLNYQAKLKKKDELKAPAPSSVEETEIINAITYDISTSIHELSSARKNMNFSRQEAWLEGRRYFPGYFNHYFDV